MRAASGPNYAGAHPAGPVNISVDVEHGVYGSSPESEEIVLHPMRFVPGKPSVEKRDDESVGIGAMSTYEPKKVEVI